MTFWNFVGCTAAVCGAISLIPELIKALKTHHLQDVSWGMLLMLITSSALWGVYGFSQNDMPLFVSALVNLTFELTLTSLKAHYEKTGVYLMKHLAIKKEKKHQLTLALETENIEEEAPQNFSQKNKN